MNDARLIYWRESLGAAMADVESDLRFDPTVHGLPAWAFECVVQGLSNSAENESMALGYDAIDRGADLTREIEDLRCQLTKEKERASNALHDLNDSETMKAHWERRARKAERELEEGKWNRLMGRG